jgi:hypothetical protein
LQESGNPVLAFTDRALGGRENGRVEAWHASRLCPKLQIRPGAADNQSVSVCRPLLFAFAAGSMMLGAIGVLSPVLSTLLWLPSALVLACHPSSPLVRMISNGLLRNGK